MKILITGAGALGGLLGARFIEAGEEVYFFDVNPLIIEAINRGGLIVEETDGTVKQLRPKGALNNLNNCHDVFDLILISVKSYATEKAAKTLIFSGIVTEKTLVLSLQNGLGNGEILSHTFGEHRIILGTTSQGATMLKPGSLRHGGNGPTVLGVLNTNWVSILDPVVQLFKQAGLEVHTKEDVKTLIWEKLIVNIGINAITALTNVLNGRIYDFEPARNLCLIAVEEAIAVAKAVGVTVRDDMKDHVLLVAKATGKNRSSMRQDLELKRPTEIDAINGAVVRLGLEKGVKTPVNWTLVQLIKTIELRNMTGGEM